MSWQQGLSRSTPIKHEPSALPAGRSLTSPVGFFLHRRHPRRQTGKVFPRAAGVVSVLILLLGVGVACQGEATPLPQGQFPLVERWHADVGSNIVVPPVVDDGKVIIRTAREAYALDLGTGALLWDVPVPAENIPTPTLVGHNVVVVGSLQGASVFDEDTGHLIWNAPPPEGGEYPNKMACRATVPAALGETTLYVVRYNCDVLAYSLATGELLWRVTLPGGRAAADVFADQDKVYLLISPDILQVRDSATGALESEFTGRIDWPAAYEAGVLYGFQRDNGGLVAVDARTGGSRWSAPGVYSAEIPLVANGYVVVVSNALEAYSVQMGQLLLRTSLASNDSYQTPVLLEDTLYLRGVYSGRIYAVSLEDEQVLGSLPTGSRTMVWSWEENWRPVAGAGMLIVPLGGTVYAYGK